MKTNADRTTPGWIIEVLAGSEAQIDSGQTVALEPVLDRLRASIARIKAGRANSSA